MYKNGGYARRGVQEITARKWMHEGRENPHGGWDGEEDRITHNKEGYRAGRDRERERDVGEDMEGKREGGEEEGRRGDGREGCTRRLREGGGFLIPIRGGRWTKSDEV